MTKLSFSACRLGPIRAGLAPGQALIPLQRCSAGYWPLLASLALATFPAWGQGSLVLHSGESVFTISVRGGTGVRFSGSCLATRSDGAPVGTKLEGIVPATFEIAGAELHLAVQNLTAATPPEIRLRNDGVGALDEELAGAASGSWLEVEISKNGAAIKRQRTNAPHGVVSLGTQPLPRGSAINTEFHVDGQRFALVTLTSETGDIEQQLVPVPFDRVLYSPEGSIVSLTAQKVRVTRLDPVHSDGKLEIMDDGQGGELQVTIRVNGQPVGSANTSEPFGVASTTVKVP